MPPRLLVNAFKESLLRDAMTVPGDSHGKHTIHNNKNHQFYFLCNDGASVYFGSSAQILLHGSHSYWHISILLKSKTQNHVLSASSTYTCYDVPGQGLNRNEGTNDLFLFLATLNFGCTVDMGI